MWHVNIFASTRRIRIEAPQKYRELIPVLVVSGLKIKSSKLLCTVTNLASSSVVIRVELFERELHTRDV